jgi:hypothetical protein
MSLPLFNFDLIVEVAMQCGSTSPNEDVTYKTIYTKKHNSTYSGSGFKELFLFMVYITFAQSS